MRGAAKALVVSGGALQLGAISEGQLLKRQGDQIVGEDSTSGGGPHTHSIADVDALQAALDSKGTSSFSGSYLDLTNKPTIPSTKGDVGLGNVDNTADTAKPVSTAQQTALNLKANVASPTFTGTVAGVTAAMVGLGNVDNTSDAAKPVSTAQQTALNLKAPAANPTFTGNITFAGQIITDSVTGLMIGTSGTQKLGFFGVTPVVRQSAFTQTYSTASKTHAAVTQLAAPAGGTGAAAGGWSTAANRDLAIASINAARNDIANVKQVLNALIDDLQALGIIQ